MLDIDVPDEFLERYRDVAPLALYRQLLAGDPDQVERVAGAWDTVASSVRVIATDLAAGLQTLSEVWTGPGADAYRERVAVLVAWSDRLADDADAMRTGLTVMAAALATAQRTAESPMSDGDDVEPQIGLVGPAFGRLLPPLLRGRVQERLVEVVAGLAVEYAVAEHTVWHGPRPDPAGRPGAPPDHPTAGNASAGTASAGNTSAGLASGDDAAVSTPTPGSAAVVALAAEKPSPVPSALSTLAGGSAAQAGVAATTHLIAPTGIESSPAAATTAMPPMLGSGAMGASTTDSGDGGRRWREDATAVDPASIAWTEQTEQTEQPPPATLGDHAWR